MDKELLREIIKEYKMILNVVNNRIKQLEQLDVVEPVATSSIQQEIENRRREIMAQIQKSRDEAEKQVQQALRNNVAPVIPSMPNGLTLPKIK